MKKTFKRTIACLLAVLMVVLSMPFTASAAQACRNWWENSANPDGSYEVVDVSPGKLTAEPKYFGYNSDEGIWNQEYGPWQIPYGQGIVFLTDTSFGFPADAEDHRDDYKPVIGITVSDISQSATWENDFYGSKTSNTMDVIREKGKIMNPADLHAGDKIAVTLEFGGFDLLATSQFKGTYDTTKLKTAYWAPGARGAKNWTEVTGTNVTQAWVASGASLGCYGANMMFPATTTSYGTFYCAIMGYNGGNGSTFIGTGKDDRPYGEYGIVSGTLSFEVLEDCDLSEVINFLPSVFGVEDGTYFEPYRVQDFGGTKQNDKTQWRVSVNSKSNDVFANAALIWTDYVSDEAPEHEHSFDGAVAVPDNAGNHTYTCTAEGCPGGEGSTKTEACTAAADKVGVVEAKCDAPGYSGDTVCKDCGYVMEEGTETTVPHTPSAWAHDADSSPSTHSRNCSVCGTNKETAECVFSYAVTTPATYTSAGEGTYTCTEAECGYSYTVVIDKLTCDHPDAQVELQNQKDATCTANGYTGDKYCKQCETVIEYGQETDMAAHTPGAWAHVEGTEKADAKHSRTCTVCSGDYQEEACKFNYTIVEPATEKTEGTGRYTCSECSYSYDVTIPMVDCDHPAESQRVEGQKAATCLAAGYTGDTFCDKCGNQIATGQDIAQLSHEYSELVSDKVDATCEKAGQEAVYKCVNGCEKTTGGEEIAQLSHEYSELVSDKVDATCEKAGQEAVYKCVNGCEKTIGGEEIAQLSHEYSELVSDKVDATCEKAGQEAVYKCVNGCAQTTGGEEIKQLEHSYTELVSAEVPATVYEAGKTAEYKCVNGCAQTIGGVEIPVIPSYTVTVVGQDMGQVTIDDGTRGPVEANDGLTVKVAKTPVGTVTLTAVAPEGVEFVGWTANGLTLVSTDATFTPTVLANITYTPVFAKVVIPDDAEFTVTFVDAFGNVVSAQHVTSGAQVVVPAGPNRPGYTFDGWSMTNEEIAQLAEAATITPNYSAADADGYVVTATGATITVAGAETPDEVTGIAYDTRVTVYKEGAKSWTINGVTVAYGDTYSFYVGSDVTVVPVMDGDDVAAAPTVANVSVTKEGTAGAYKFTFLATRSMEGFTVVNFGFVYSKTGATDIDLDKVDGTNVKAAYCKTTAEQFSLTYGLSSQKGTVSARPFVAYVDGNGDTQVVYADAQLGQY